jgi:hypothetical protein
LAYSLGDLTVEGTHFKTADPTPIIGYNNDTAPNMRDLGILYQRYQKSNDIAHGEVVNDLSFETNVLPSQSTASASQVIFNMSANAADDYYNGAWIKVNSQVRQIVSYNGNQRVATLDNAFTVNPVQMDTVSIYKRSFATQYFDGDTFVLGYTNSTGTTLTSQGFADLKLNKIVSVDVTPSMNASTGSLVLNGSIALSNTAPATSSTHGGTITTLGGVGIGKSLMVNQSIGIGGSGFTPLSDLHIKTDTDAGIRIESEMGSSIDFVKNTDIFNINYTGDLFSLNDTMNVVSDKIGINTTNVSGALTIASNSFISTDATSGFLGISGSASESSGSRMILDNSLEIYANDTMNFYTNDTTSALQIDNNGVINIFSTQPSSSPNVGALAVRGGMSISATANATSYTSGGALTVNGGVSVKKDLYLGGDLYIAGALTAEGNFIPATLAFSDPVNCTLNEYRNSNLMIIGGSCILSFELSVIPDSADLNTQITFSLPELGSNLSYRGQVLIQVSGYTDSNELVVLYNVLSVGIPGTKTALVKFQSASTDIHYLQIQATYAR